jgi:ubiquinone biosynthesis protein
VVVKVQKPGVAESVAQDLEVLRDVVKQIVSRSKWAGKHDLEGLIDEFSFYLHNELDYVREGQNAEKFRAMFKDNPGIFVPKVYWEYTTSKVLVLDEVKGIKVTTGRV